MRLLFIATITLGSALLFLVQPLCARQFLPMLGGAPAVWTTCLLFFQAGLLAGYAYAHLIPRRLGARAHAALHAILFLAALLFLPLTIPRSTAPPEHPALWLLGALFIAVALPYFLLASNAPLLQKWFAQRFPGRDPYFLYAASNLGSFAGLLAYPFWFEPAFTLSDQGWYWSAGFVALAVLTVACAAPLILKAEPRLQDQEATPAPTAPNAWQYVRWTLLALVPASLMMSVTHYLTADIAPLPLLWIVPLGLYLLTFVITFAQPSWLSQGVLVRFSPLAAVVVTLLFIREANEPVLAVMSLHLAVFCLLALLCHGELARTRPPVQHLTGFYLCLALGGVLAGVLNGLLAPLLFKGLWEYPLVIVLAMLLRPRLEDLAQSTAPPPWRLANRADLAWAGAIFLATLALVLIAPSLGLEPDGLGLAIVYVPSVLVAYVFNERPVRFALAIGGILLASHFQTSAIGQIVYQNRSFFGIHRVTEKEGRRFLTHGNTVHGSQFLSGPRRREPLTYYTRVGPAGVALQSLEKEPILERVGVVGLGTGSLAAYADPESTWTFFEIDPVVVHIARDTGLFTFLADAQKRRARLAYEIGDARLTLRSYPQKLGLLILDAFGSDAIPTHLLTREAFLEYRGKLEDSGAILLNISHRYLDLEPVLANIAKDLGWRCRIWHDLTLQPDDEKKGKSPSIWALMTWDDARIGALLRGAWQDAKPQEDLGIWRDDYANILPLIRW